MKKIKELTKRKGWVLWNAAVWSGLAIVWTRRFLLTRELIQKGNFSDVLGKQDLMANGLLAGMGLLLAIAWWSKWFRYDKKQFHQKDEEK